MNLTFRKITFSQKFQLDFHGKREVYLQRVFFSVAGRLTSRGVTPLMPALFTSAN
jgi:hypothetical protein